MLLPASRRPRLLRAALIGVAVAAVIAGAGVWLLRYQPLRQAGDLQLGGTAEVVLVEEFEGSGAHIARYRDGGYVTYAVTVRNAGPIPVAVTGIPLPSESERRLLQPVGAGLVGAGEAVEAEGMRAFEPFELAPGAQQRIVLHARFDNCEYYTERAVELIEEQAIDVRIAGLDRHVRVPLSRPLLVRSPTIQRCPERTLDRSEHRRTAPGG